MSDESKQDEPVYIEWLGVRQLSEAWLREQSDLVQCLEKLSEIERERDELERQRRAERISWEISYDLLKSKRDELEGKLTKAVEALSQAQQSIADGGTAKAYRVITETLLTLQGETK